jgi:hypothetical protein
MTTALHRSPVTLALALAAGIGVVASIVALAPASQAAPAGWRSLAAVPAPALAAGTRIEVDDQGKVIRFFIDGQQLAMLDSVGLHVQDDVATE